MRFELRDMRYSFCCGNERLTETCANLSDPATLQRGVGSRAKLLANRSMKMLSTGNSWMDCGPAGESGEAILSAERPRTQPRAANKAANPRKNCGEIRRRESWRGAARGEEQARLRNARNPQSHPPREAASDCFRGMRDLEWRRNNLLYGDQDRTRTDNRPLMFEPPSLAICGAMSTAKPAKSAGSVL